MTCGIYCITNKFTGKMYIGKSVNIERRWREHNYGHDCPNSYIDNAIQKHGKDAFDYNILFECCKEDLDVEEQKFIKLYSTYNQGYNLTKGGEGSLGFCLSEETKKKISEAHKGKIYSEETKKKMSESRSGEGNGMYGKHHSEETKKKISNALKGRKMSDEFKKRCSILFKGRKHSEESKQKMSEAQKGKTLSKETRLKLSESHKGIHPSIETKIKMSKSRNSSGIFRVCLKVDKRYPNQVRYIYAYRSKEGRISFSSLCPNELKQKVLDKGLEWIILDEEKAKANGLEV